MRKILILIPVYNDWESFQKLINDINENINDIKDTFKRHRYYGTFKDLLHNSLEL